MTEIETCKIKKVFFDTASNGDENRLYNLLFAIILVSPNILQTFRSNKLKSKNDLLQLYKKSYDFKFICLLFNESQKILTKTLKGPTQNAIEGYRGMEYGIINAILRNVSSKTIDLAQFSSSPLVSNDEPVESVIENVKNIFIQLFY